MMRVEVSGNDEEAPLFLEDRPLDHRGIRYLGGEGIWGTPGWLQDR